MLYRKYCSLKYAARVVDNCHNFFITWATRRGQSYLEERLFSVSSVLAFPGNGKGLKVSPKAVDNFCMIEKIQSRTAGTKNHASDELAKVCVS